MKKLSVFDPAMCCSTGVCGPDPDQALIDFASDFDWLKAHGVPAERWNLANQPMAFVLNHKASAFLRAKGSDALPLILVDNEERLSGRYPSRSELSEWFGIPMTACERARELEKSTGISAEAVCGPECGCGESPKASSQSTLKDTVSGLKFLENAPHTLFFTGKGGVGKTSVAAAAAVALAGLGKRVLLVSTDPASNVSQVFDQPIGNQVTAIQSVPGLSAIEIDPQAAAAAYREKLIQPIQGLLPEETVASITEQLSGACTTEIAAFDEFTGLLTDPGVTSQYDHILFDTAPTGHTIRLLELPGAWSQYLDANPNGTSCLGPVSGLDKQRSQYAAAVRSLSDPAETQLVLVARAHRASIREAARTSDELAGIKNQYLVLNGVMPATESASGALAQSICLRERKAITEIPEPLKSLPRDTLSLKPRNMVGVDALRTLFIKETGTKPEATAFMPPEPKPLSDLIDELSGTDHGLIMLMGKGGVGKTTMAAAIAARLAKLGFDVHLSTSDPAAHVDAALAGSVPGLTVSRIDPEKETENYRALVLKTQGAGLDEAGKKLLEEDLRSPCTEEIAVFQAFSRVIREADKRFVVMDTAPTGHTLLLLDAAGAYHREVVRKMGETGSGTTPLTLLQNPDMTRVIIVTLPETTPVLEAKGLEADLRRAGIAPWGYIVNDSLAAADPESPLLRERATSELPLIRKIESESPRTAIVPLQAEEPVGVEELLWLSEVRSEVR